MKFVVLSCYNDITEKFLPPQIIQSLPDEDIVDQNVSAVKLGKIDKQTASMSTIYKLGYYDDKTGKFDLLDEPLKLVSLSDYISKKKVEAEQHVESD